MAKPPEVVYVMHPMRSQLAVLALALSSTLLASAPARAGEPRRHSGLVVADVPRSPSETGLGRRFPDIEGALTMGAPRVWVGAPVPAHVAIGEGDLELWALWPTDRGHLGLYVEPFAVAGSDRGCKGMWGNCRYLVRHYLSDGTLAFEVDPAAHMTRKDHIALHDLTLVGDTLYLSEACQTYSKEAGGKCSTVAALDVSKAPATLRWRSKPLVSNSDIVPIEAGRWLVTGYGFTAERDSLHLLDATSGKVVHKLAVKKAPERITLSPEGLVLAHLYDEPEPRAFRVVPGKKTPKLVPADR